MKSFSLYRIVRQRQQRQAHFRNEGGRTTAKVVMIVPGLLVVVLLMGVVAGGFLFAREADRFGSTRVLPAYFDAESGVLLRPTRIYDRTGEVLLHTIGPAAVPRAFLAYEAFSPWLIKATVAAAAPDYWSDGGFLATWQEEESIPAQVVERVLLRGEESRRLMRLWLRASLLYEYGREDVLAFYLNSNSYGRQTFGAEQAAYYYFDKSAAELTLAEAAMLAAVQQSPALNPVDAPLSALENKDALLAMMAAEGVISDEEYQQALSQEIVFRAINPIDEQPDAFSALVIDRVAEEIPMEQLLLGGYSIVSTLDANLQAQTTCVLQEQLRRLTGDITEGDYSVLETCEAARFLAALPPDVQNSSGEPFGSGMLMDPRTGEVLALVDHLRADGVEEGSLAKYPGTSLAPMIALTAFSRGESPATLRWDLPGDDPRQLAQYLAEDWPYQGPMRSRQAILQNNRLVLAEWMLALGESDVMRLADTMGLHSLQQSPAAAQLLFEGGNVSLIELGWAYSVFANLGTQAGSADAGNSQQISPRMVMSVSNVYGEILPLSCTTAQSTTVVEQELAYLVHDMLADEISRRSLYGYPNPLNIGRPVAAMAASSHQDQQRWTLGYTPQVLGGVWIGSREDWPLGMSSTANVWHALMRYAMLDLPVEGWNRPAGVVDVTVCDPSGLLPTTACQRLASEVFLQGNQPTRLDSLYQQFAINRETGRLATVFTPLELIDEQVFLVVPPEGLAWAQANGLALPPDDYDTIQALPVYEFTRLTTPENFSYASGLVEFRGTAAGDDFQSYRLQVGEGLNPDRWVQIGEESTQPVGDGILGVWDTTGLEGLYAVRLVTERAGQLVETAILQVTIDNTPPEVTLVSAETLSEISANSRGEYLFQVRVEDNIGIAVVRWYIDEILVEERGQAPFNAYLSLRPGQYSLQAEVVDWAGNSTLTEVFEIVIID
jgi:membrane peptidoglycan carboxypeptidase